MNSKFYARYINVFKYILGQTTEYSELDYYTLATDVDDHLELIVKYYHQSKNGMSSQLTHANPDDAFYISAPIGKGLDINYNNLKGHIAVFVGGTGILPFMDFFAYLGRRFIAKVNKNVTVFSNEGFNLDTSDMRVTVYAYYSDIKNAIGLVFMDLLSKVFKAYD